ncbi:MAG: hypothetical protein K0U37_05630 [Gammaproteobacteria bacterium]|nr:hypothetical protein [Gammaproteobacteria bacterium]
MQTSFKDAKIPLERARQQRDNQNTDLNNAFTRKVRQALIKKGIFESPDQTDKKSPFKPLNLTSEATPPLTPTPTDSSPSI